MFTPVDKKTNKRLKFKDSEVKEITGRIVKIKDKLYFVTSKSCGAPCHCDSWIEKLI